jgi:hypothetical protein
MTKRLFLGGPWHERERDIPAGEWHYRVAQPMSQADLDDLRMYKSPPATYVRKRMAYPNTKQMRSIFVPEWWSDAEAREALVAYLMIRWVRENPDS